MKKTAFLYTEKYFSYDYGVSHPLKIERLRLTHDLCNAFGLFSLESGEEKETAPASELDVRRFHYPEYLRALKQASRGELKQATEFGLGAGDNPIFPGLWEWSLLHTGASLQCARMVLREEVSIAFNIAGGLHHAHANRASGFCYINDPVLAILTLLDAGKRVLYLDVDAHHGDGVQWAFYGDPRVLTVSYHQDGRTLFPCSGAVSELGKGEGTGYAVNIPMLPGTDDKSFWESFSRLVPRLMDAFKPDVVVSQLGVDSFFSDPLANLELTTEGFCRVVRYLRDEAPAWVALGGGGYDIGNVARAWTLAWAEMNGVNLPDRLPEKMVGNFPNDPYHGKLRLPSHDSKRQKDCRQFLTKVTEYLEEKALPFISS
jgi:acetoin utilization protein AcuC